VKHLAVIDASDGLHATRCFASTQRGYRRCLMP